MGDIIEMIEKIKNIKKQRDELLKALKDTTSTLDYIINCDFVDMEEVRYENEEVIEEYQKLIAEIEEGENE
jgi:hypothetical protein